MVLEVFTDKEKDAEAIRTILEPYKAEDRSFRHTVGKILPEDVKKVIRKVID